MISVEDFNLRLSASKDILIGFQKSDLALVPLQEDELRIRARSLVRFLAGMDADGLAPPPWFDEIAASAEDYLMDCLIRSMASSRQAPMNVLPPLDVSIKPRSRPWWRLWSR